MVSSRSGKRKEIPEEIRIGDTVSYTGHHAAFGVDSWGVKAAFEDMNKQGGLYVKEFDSKLPVRYITRDTQSDMLKIAPLTEELILREKIHFLGPHLEVAEMRFGMALMANRYKVPTLVGVGPFEPWMDLCKAAGGPWKYVWTYCGATIGTPPEPGDFRYGNPGYLVMPTWFGALDAYAVQTNKKVAVFALDDHDGRGWYKAFTGIAEEKGFDCYGADKQFGIFSSETTDFSPIIQEWLKEGCEVLWGSCPGPIYGKLWKQCHRLGFQPKLVFATRAAIHYRDIAAWGDDLPNGIGMEIYWVPSIKNAHGIGETTPSSLAERWYKDTCEPLSQGIGWDYMAAQILFNAIERAGTLDPELVVEALSKTDLVTIYGRAKFESGTQYHRCPVAFGQWRKTDKPWRWEAPIVFSYNDFMPATADFIFPMPYRQSQQGKEKRNTESNSNLFRPDAV
jgi:branched-chain amino acid transport system substrate-binding protein